MNRIARIIAYLQANREKIEMIDVGSIAFHFAHQKIKPELKESHDCLLPDPQPNYEIVDKGDRGKVTY